jgi:GT2 family glycosyltransferase
MNKIGVAIITCNRQTLFSVCLDSLKKCSYDELIVINDGAPINDNFDCEIINNEKNLGVGLSKNKAMSILLARNCNFLFIIEDDMFIKDKDILQKYIYAHNVTGLHHFMFAYHGYANKDYNTKSATPRVVIDYDNVKISLNRHCVGAFCFYTKSSLQDVGLNDDKFYNAFEHVDHSFRLAKKGYSTPYWWWADIANSLDLIDEQCAPDVNSSIRYKPDWEKTMNNSMKYFVEKHKTSPLHVPDASTEEVVDFLKKIKVKNA